MDLLLAVQQRASRGSIDALAQLAVEDHKHVSGRDCGKLLMEALVQQAHDQRDGVAAALTQQLLGARDLAHADPVVGWVACEHTSMLSLGTQPRSNLPEQTLWRHPHCPRVWLDAG